MDLRRLALLTLIALPIGCSAAPPAPAPPVHTGQPMASPPPPKSEAPLADSKPAPPQGSSAPAPAAPSAAVVGDSMGGGRLSQAEIRDIVTASAALFDACYLIGAGKSQLFTATVTVKATIGPSGAVNEAQIKSSTAKNKKVDTCVADAFKQLKFPAPKGAVTSVITFPMEFSGGEE